MPFTQPRAKTVLLEQSDLLVIVLFSIVPLFLHFPYRVNIFLSWEGAYRLYLGQVPYKDFGLPMGFGYWLVPAVFFKLFGPYFLSLIKAQVLLNIVAGCCFRGILKKLEVPVGIRIAAVLTYGLSYILLNFWPWYNNSVILWQIVGLYFLLGFLQSLARSRYLQLLAACFFLFLSFFTKQDGGALAFLVAFILVLYHAVESRRWKDLLLYLGVYAGMALLVILPFTRFGFGYWFNHGQPPHSSRIAFKDFLDVLLGESQWIKFYLLLIVLLLAAGPTPWKAFFRQRQPMLLLLLTLGILFEAAIFQVTSYTPPDNNVFVHSFAFAFIVTAIGRVASRDFSTGRFALLLSAVVLIWWSGMYWRYVDRLAMRLFPSMEQQAAPAGGENVINRHTFMLNLDTTRYEDESSWIAVPGLASFRNMYLPPSTVAGIGRLMQSPVVTAKKPLKLLNMTELTPLEYELGAPPEKGQDYPLWYHLGVSMFNQQADAFCKKIGQQQYDLVLFEYVPGLNNFYPFRVRDSLQQHYTKVDSFFAPRRPTNGMIEVYRRKVALPQ